MATRTTKETVLTRKHVARLERERRQSQVIRMSAIVLAAIVVGGLLLTSFFDGVLSIGKFNINYLIRNRPVVKLEGETATMYDFQMNVRLRRQGLLNQYFTYAQYAQFGVDVQEQLDSINTQLSAEGAELLGADVVDSLVNDLLVRVEAKKRGITVTDEEIDARIREIFEFYPEGTPTPTLTPTEFVAPTLSEAQLALITLTPTPTLTPDGTQTETPIPSDAATSTPDLVSTATSTPEQSPTPSETPTPAPTNTPTLTPEATFTASPTFTPSATPTPYTLEGFEESFANSMESYNTQLQVTEADYRKLVESEIIREKVYEAITADVEATDEQVWARHILVEDVATAEDLYDRLMAGEDWGALAAEFSTDTGNKDLGGDLGWFGRGMMVAEFETAAFEAEPGTITEPVASQFGWHLIQVIGHEERPLTSEALAQKKDAVFNEWLLGARQAAEEAGTLEIFDIWMAYVPTSPNLEELQEQAQQQGQ